MEVLLATALVVLLLSLGIAGFGRLYDTEKIGEAGRRMESILRLARADAAARGRRIRLSFDRETLALLIEWEPKPLAEPGTFVPLTSASWANQPPLTAVRFRRCERTGSSAMQTLTYQQEDELQSEDGKVLQSVTFYPDGSCDSAIVEIAGRDESELRIARIDLDGVTGTVTMRILTPIEQEEQEQFDAEAEGL